MFQLSTGTYFHATDLTH